MRISDWSSDVCSSDLIKYLTRLLRRRHVKRQGVQNAADDPDLLGVGPRELALACVERILKSHPHIASVDRRHRDEGKLVAACRHHRPLIIAAKKLVRDTLRMEQIFGVRSLPAQNAEDGLDEERRRDRKSTRLNSSH